MPQPSSVTAILLTPPASSITRSVRAPASSAFSTSSFTTDAGRSTTSPAAIWLTRRPGRTAIDRAMALNIDRFLGAFILEYGAWVYPALFLIVFCETGLVVFPFLPGDSLLFVGGAFCATGALTLPALIMLLLVAAALGNTVNYQIGRMIGPKVFESNWR